MGRALRASSSETESRYRSSASVSCAITTLSTPSAPLISARQLESSSLQPSTCFCRSKPSMAVMAALTRGAAPGDATLVYDKNKGHVRGAPEKPKLLVTAGPKKGTEFPLAVDKVSIGRGTDNVFVIPDISVSRAHVSIEREGEKWVAVDLKS